MFLSCTKEVEIPYTACAAGQPSKGPLEDGQARAPLHARPCLLRNFVPILQEEKHIWLSLYCLVPAWNRWPSQALRAWQGAQPETQALATLPSKAWAGLGLNPK